MIFLLAIIRLVLISQILFFIRANCGNGLDKHFYKWMLKNLKEDQVKAIVRDDMTTGSFGGGIYTGKMRPIIFIHGLNNEAGSLWKVRRDIVAGGFPVQQTFATTWGNGEQSFDLSATMKCEYIHHIRQFINTVLSYTGFKQVDLIAYSMGSPMSRKAILGGKCVDRPDFDLGPRITSKIHTFISVAGANHGSQLCEFPFFEVCNKVNGLNCESEFLKDINSKRNYESSYRSFNLASTGDMVVGYTVCGKKASRFYGSKEWKIEDKGHEETEYDTGDIQLKMIKEGYEGISRRRPSQEKQPKRKCIMRVGSNPFNEVKRYLWHRKP